MSTLSKILATALCCLLALPSVGQIPVEIPQGDGNDRFTEVHRAYAQDPSDVEALYNMALYYFDNSTSMRNLPTAMRYIRKAEEQQVYLLENNKIRKLTKLTKKGIDIMLLRQTKQNIHEAARQYLSLQPRLTDVEIDEYFDVFGNDREMAKVLRQMRMRQIYDESLRQATPEAYYNYFVTYPGTVEADQMEELLRQEVSTIFASCASEAAVDSVAARYPQSSAVQQAAVRHKSRIAFAEAARVGTAGAYNTFLSRYPASDESQQARHILEEYALFDFSQRRTAMELLHFADSNADSPLVDQALTEARRLIYDNHDIEAARYYVGHFPLDAHYSEVYGRYYSWHSLEGNAAPLRIFENQNPDFPFPHALESDLEQAEDADTILLLGPYREERYIRYASYVRYLTGRGLSFVPLQRMLQPLLTARRYPEAIERVQQFDISFENRWADRYADLLQILATPHPARTLRAELEGEGISSPVINPADGTLYFTRTTPAGNLICRLVGPRTSPSVQTSSFDTVHFANTDATDLVLFNFFDGGRKMLLGSGGDIWIAERDGDGWRISDLPPYPVNTDYIETDAYMVPDGSGMLLASDRPGGHNLQLSGAYFHGDTALATDLWFIPYGSYGWGTPVNLGISLNTPYCERSPLLSSNLCTLYFISDGYGGLGYGDVMVAERTSSGWTSWSTPQNVGREINGPYWEQGLSFSPDEKRIYLSTLHSPLSTLQSFATWHDTADSYSTCRLGVRGLERSLLRVSVADLDRQEVVQQIDYSDGAPTLGLNLRDSTRYVVFADAVDRFVPALLITQAVKQSNNQALSLRGYTLAELVSAERALPLPAVGFRPATAQLLPLGRMQLDRLVRFLERHPQANIEFGIDVPGTDARECYEFSLDRGNTMRAYLAAHGIEPARVHLSPYGNVHAGPRGTAAVTVRFRD